MTGGQGRAAAHAALLAALYEAQRQRLYAYLWSWTLQREDALDLLQEVWVRAWRHAAHLAGLPPPAQAAWLFACARHLAIDHYRRRRTAMAGAAAGEPTPAVAPAADPAQAAEGAEAVRRVHCAVLQLPAPWREALALRVLGEMSSGEIAQVLGVSAATVRYRVMQARRALRRALASEEGDDGHHGAGG